MCVGLVSLADKTHNARAILEDYRDIGDAIWDPQERDLSCTTPFFCPWLLSLGRRVQALDLFRAPGLAEARRVFLLR